MRTLLYEQMSGNEVACRTLIAYVDERYPIKGGWQAFDNQRKIQEALKAQVLGVYDGPHARATEAPPKYVLAGVKSSAQLA